MGVSFITGGMGYVGKNLTEELLRKNENVVIFDVYIDERVREKYKNSIKYIVGNLGNQSEVLQAIKESMPDTIYHLGAMITLAAEQNPWAAYNTNANGTYHILEAARLFDIHKIVFPSGIATYSPPLPETINEDVFQSAPNQMYGVTKIFCERLGEYYNQKFGTDFRCVSLPAICGPGRKEGLAAYASLMIEENVNGKVCKLPIDENVQMPFIYIKDVIRCLTGISYADAKSLKRRVYSIQGFSLSAKEMVSVLKEIIASAKVEFDPVEKIVKLANDMPNNVDDSRARNDWGWSAQYDWEETVNDFVRVVRSEK